MGINLNILCMVILILNNNILIERHTIMKKLVKLLKYCTIVPTLGSIHDLHPGYDNFSTMIEFFYIFIFFNFSFMTWVSIWVYIIVHMIILQWKLSIKTNIMNSSGKKERKRKTFEIFHNRMYFTINFWFAPRLWQFTQQISPKDRKSKILLWHSLFGYSFEYTLHDYFDN